MHSFGASKSHGSFAARTSAQDDRFIFDPFKMVRMRGEQVSS